MNKLLAGLQVVLSGLAAYAAWYLAELKAHPSSITGADGTGAIIVNTPPPDRTLEVFLTIVGLAILGITMAQAARRIRLSNWQMVCGALILGISSFLLGRTTAFQYRGDSPIYSISYLAMAAGILAAVIGVIQLVNDVKHRSAAAKTGKA